ncbi:MAG TPA: serine hydrolase domain-containing protein [Candidatus Sulfotelmatobacter sp.]
MNTRPSTALIPSFDHQDVVFASAFSVLREAIAERAFPAASIAVTQQDRLVALKSLGHFTYDADAPPFPNFEVTSSTLFDIASVTKPIATTTMAAILHERGLLELDAPIVGTLPEFLADACEEVDARRRNVTFRMLLDHSSGLPSYEKLFLKAHSRDELLFAAFSTSLSADPGTRGEYSDIGFIILGAALERIAQESLDLFCQREIFGPLAMTNTTFDPGKELRSSIPATADDRIFRKRIIQGEVQDENAYVLGGVAGHAGLFSTAEDLARFAHAMLQYQNCHFEEAEANTTVGRDTPSFSQAHNDANSREAISKPILRPETLALFTRREVLPPGTTRALGWDTPATPSQSGKYFGPRSYGHLGYTGTSLWIDPDRELSITLLTNRTWPDCSNQAIKLVRPKFHDAVVEALT